MNWSNMALKATIGAGSLVPVAILTDAVEPFIGVWGIIAVVLVPLTLLVFFKIGDDVPAPYVMIAHTVAVAWYGALVIATVGFMAWRGLVPTDGLMGFLLLLGVIPCVFIVRALWRGDYLGDA